MNYSSFDYFDYNYNDTSHYYNNNYTYAFEEPDDTPAYQIPVNHIYTSGIVLNGIFTLILVCILAISPEQRSLPRLWLVLGIIIANLLQLIFARISDYISRWSVALSSNIMCGLLLNLPQCFEYVSILTSVLLSFNIYMWVCVPTAERGQRKLFLWIIAEVVCWILGFAVVLGIRVSSAEVTEIQVGLINTLTARFCHSYIRSASLALIYSCVTLLLPYVIALPVTCRSLTLNCRNTHHDATELAPEDGGCQLSSELSKSDQANPKGYGSRVENPSQSNELNKQSMLPWVIFNVLNIFLGFVCRLPMHLYIQKFIFETFMLMHSKVIMIWLIVSITNGAYVSFMPLLCLMLKEVKACFWGCSPSKH